MKLFVFTFGNCDYDLQHAVVLAETKDEAAALLLDDMRRQHAAHPEGDHNWKGENGFSPFYFTEERRQLAEENGEPAWDTDSRVAYCYGVDG